MFFSKNVFFVLGLFFSCYACKPEKEQVDVSDVSVKFDVIRFDRLFAAADAQSLQDLMLKYPYLFPGEHEDAFWLGYKQDTLYQELDREAQKVFKDFKTEKKSLENLFKHVKYYYPSFQPPEVLTLISNLDFDNQLIYADSLLIVSLDTYLGKDQVYYEHFPDYFKPYFDRERIPIETAKAIASKTFKTEPNGVFISKMVEAGKLMFTVHAFLPEISEETIMQYDPVKYQWTLDNEYYIWQYFMEKDYLYSSDRELLQRFLEPAPFSKFYIQNDMESPDRIGVWIGWQIVKSYMAQKQIPLQEMLVKPAMDIFNESHYKPNK